MTPHLAALLFLSVASGFAQTGPPFMAMGDSLGEGVQSANAFAASQPETYLNRVAQQMNVPFAQPLLKTSPYAFVGFSFGRSRTSLSTQPADLAVSGATVNNVLSAVASTTPSTEADLVLPPYYGMSQIQIVEQAKPNFVICWVGTDDLIAEVLNFYQLNHVQPTPLPTFTSEYQQLVSRLKATGAKAVLANIPDFTKMGYLFDNADLTRYTGTDYHLAAGSVTTLPTMILLKLGVFGPSILQNPSYVLNAAELSALETQIQSYNAVIIQTAAANNFPVVDAYSILNSLITNPITIEGITIGTHFNQGGFSLDGVHPSDTGYALFANYFIQAANAAYGMNIPQISMSRLTTIFNADPFQDFGGAGVVAGRPYTGLLESLGPVLGLSGGPGYGGAKVSVMSPARPADKNEFMRVYNTVKGQSPTKTFTDDDVIRAVADLFGVKY